MGNQTWTEWKPLTLDKYNRVEACLAAQEGGNSFGGTAAKIYTPNPCGDPDLAAGFAEVD